MLSQALVDGLIFGALLAMVAVGLTLVFGVLDIVNIAHGEVVALGAYLGYVFLVDVNLALALAVVLTIGAGALVGIVIDRSAVRPVLARAHHDDRFLAPLITTVAVSLVISNGIATLIESEPIAFPRPTWSSRFEIAGQSLTHVDLVIVVVLGVTVVALRWLLNSTRFGRQLRAVAEHPEHSSLLGIDTARVVTMTFGIASVLAVIAGLLVGLKYPLLRPSMGITWTLRGLVIIVIGGMGSIPGTVVAGLGLGVLVVVTATYFTGAIAELATFAALLAFLLLRPRGLFGAPAMGRD